METKEVDYSALLQDDENLDESPSEPVEVILPKDQEGNMCQRIIFLIDS